MTSVSVKESIQDPYINNSLYSSGKNSSYLCTMTMDEIIDAFITTIVGGFLIPKTSVLHHGCIFWVNKNNKIFFEYRTRNESEAFFVIFNVYDDLEKFFYLEDPQINKAIFAWILTHHNFFVDVFGVEYPDNRWKTIQEDLTKYNTNIYETYQFKANKV